MRKKVRLFALCCFSLFFMLNTNTTHIHALSGDSNVTIDAKESNVVNLIYHVVDEFGNNYPESIEFNLIDKNTGKVIESQFTDDEHLLFFKNIPFGSYVITPSNGNKYHGDMNVEANKKYIETQHIVKKCVVFTNKENARNQIDLGNGQSKFIKEDKQTGVATPSKTQTGDDTHYEYYLYVITGSLVVFFLIKKHLKARKELK